MAHWFSEITILALCGLGFAVFLELKRQRKQKKNFKAWAERISAELSRPGPGRPANRLS